MSANLSASIVVYDLDSDLLTQVLDSLESAISYAEQQNQLDSVSLTIIDNGNHGAALTSLLPENLKIIQNTVNVGYGAAHNQAICTSDSNIHLILNPDVILHEHLINEALKFFAERPAVVACGPLGTDDAGQNLYLAKRYPTVFDLFLRGFTPALISNAFRTRLDRYEYRDLKLNVPSEVTLLSGCCMFVRTDALKASGSFDESFFLYFEDYDLCLQLGELGQVMFVPSLQVIHHGGNSSRKGLKHIAMFCNSATRFFQKHGWRFV